MMRVFCSLFSLWVHVSSALGDPRFLTPSPTTTIVPGDVVFLLGETGIFPQISDLTSSWSLQLYTGDNEEPIAMPFTRYLSSAIQTSIGYIVAMIAPDAVNSNRTFFFGVHTTLKANTSIQMTNFSERFSISGFNGTLEQTILENINANVVGDPAPPRKFRCNLPALTFCSDSVALAGLTTSASQSAATASSASISTQTLNSAVTLKTSTASSLPISTGSQTIPTSTASPSSNSAPAASSSKNTALVAGLASAFVVAAISVILISIFLCCRHKKPVLTVPTWWSKSSSPERTSELPAGHGPYHTAELPGQDTKKVVNPDATVLVPEMKAVHPADARIIDIWDEAAERRALTEPEQVKATVGIVARPKESATDLPDTVKVSSI